MDHEETTNQGVVGRKAVEMDQEIIQPIPELSLVVASLGERQELFMRLLKSLSKHAHRIELIVVDQSDHQLLKSVMDAQNQIQNYKYIYSSRKCVCHARNIGASFAKAKLLAFPDDDCYYSPETLGIVLDRIHSDGNVDMVIGPPYQEDGMLWPGHWISREAPITWQKVWVAGVEWTMFMKTKVFRDIGGFDEKIGPGSGTPWGSGEGSDLLFRMLMVGSRIQYIPNIKVMHPAPSKALLGSPDWDKYIRYNRGFCYVNEKNKLPWWYRVYFVVRPILGSALFFLKGEFNISRSYAAIFFVRIHSVIWIRNNVQSV